MKMYYHSLLFLTMVCLIVGPVARRLVLLVDPVDLEVVIVRKLGAAQWLEWMMKDVFGQCN